MWSYAYTGEPSRFFREPQRVGVMIDQETNMTDGALFEVVTRSVARNMKTFLCHQRAAHVCKSVFLKMFGKQRGASREYSREDFTICLVLPREIFRANKGDTMGAVKQAVEGLGVDVDVVLLPWPTDKRVFSGAESTQETQLFRLGWRKTSELVRQGLIKDLGVMDFEVWQLEAALPPAAGMDDGPAASRKPCLHYISDLSPSTPRIREVCFSQQRSIDVMASVGGIEHGGLVADLMAKYSKTAVEVLATWCYQRGIVALPRLPSFLQCPQASSGGPDEYAKWKEDLNRDLQLLEALIYPLTRKHVFYAPTQRWSFSLTEAEIESLNNADNQQLDKDLGAAGEGESAAAPPTAAGTEHLARGPSGTGGAPVEEQHKAVLKHVEKDLILLDLQSPPDPGKWQVVVGVEVPAWEKERLDKRRLESGSSPRQNQDGQEDQVGQQEPQQQPPLPSQQEEEMGQSEVGVAVIGDKQIA